MCYRVFPTHKNEKQKRKTQKDEHAYHTQARKHRINKNFMKVKKSFIPIKTNI